MDTKSTLTNSNTGLIPASGNNTAIAAAPLNLTGSTSNSQTGVIEILSGTASCFDIDSFYFDCVKADDEELLDEAQECTVTVTGYQGKDITGKQLITFPSSVRSLSA